MKNVKTQLITDARFWAMIILVLFIAIVPPGKSNAGKTSTVRDSVFFYRTNTLNYLSIQDSIIKKL